MTDEKEEIIANLSWDDTDTDDNESVNLDTISQAVTTDTDWTTETILSQLRRGNIKLDPRFQRRDAWDARRKSRFIESLIIGLPIPQIVLAADRERRGKFIVLDGKQRLLALRQFAEGSEHFPRSDVPESSRSDSSSFKDLRLKNLEARDDLHGYNLAKLATEPENVDDLNDFLNQTIRTVVVRSWPDEKFLNMVFLRLNTGSVQLSPQELRQALHPGPFMDFIDDWTMRSSGARRAIRGSGPDFRMRDVELVLRYFAFAGNLAGYRGDLLKFLDTAASALNAQWLTGEADIRQTAEVFDSSVDAAFNVFGSNAFFRWNGEKSSYERRFNRALFDVVMYHFRDPNIRSAAVERRVEVEEALKNLCVNDSDFATYIQVTTKSVSATFERISKWGTALSEVLGVELPSPSPAPSKA